MTCLLRRILAKLRVFRLLECPRDICSNSVGTNDKLRAIAQSRIVQAERSVDCLVCLLTTDQQFERRHIDTQDRSDKIIFCISSKKWIAESPRTAIHEWTRL